jgi:hypothetical protein
VEDGREITLSMLADHEQMVRFSGRKDPGYLQVALVLKRWCNDIKSQQERVMLDSQPGM